MGARSAGRTRGVRVRARRPAVPHAAGLDGLRALAVLGVLGHHLDLGWAGGGFLGVEVFFTLSGFLITQLLVAELARTGRVDAAGPRRAGRRGRGRGSAAGAGRGGGAPPLGGAEQRRAARGRGEHAPDVAFVDWASLVAGRPGVLGPDAVHPTPAGRRLLAAAVADALRR